MKILTTSVMWYKIDWLKLGKILTPTFLRSKLFIVWVSIISEIVEYIHYLFLQNRDANIYDLAHNSQICYLRSVLNDRFDPGMRRITISSGNAFTRQYIYTDGEQKPKYLGTMFLYDDGDYEDTGVDFIVRVPSDVVFSIYAMTALVDYYKLASKRYKIIRI